MSSTTEKDNSSGKKFLLLGIVIVLLLINAIQFYLQTKSKQEIQEKIVVIENKDAEIKVYGYKLDSIGNELQTRYDEIAKLGGDTASMGELIRKLKIEKRSLASAKMNIESKYNSIKSKYDEVMNNKDGEISTLREERDSLFRENNTLKRAQVSLNDSVVELKVKRDELSKQVALASVLKAANVKIIYISTKDKEVTDLEYKAKKLSKLKIMFDVIENKVAKIETKTFYIRVIEPDGAALYNTSNGGGSFQLEGKEVFFSQKQEILYDQTQKTVTCIYNKGAAYKPGKHQLEVYCEGGIIGRGTFTLL
ncbi:MAG: hypothetical protein EAZ53_09195 [Bacteroidetes bacterium]|nr:MAG: hypothetical protein EAZ53_09195 [Bacteroidota bacterium]